MRGLKLHYYRRQYLIGGGIRFRIRMICRQLWKRDRPRPWRTRIRCCSL